MSVDDGTSNNCQPGSFKGPSPASTPKIQESLAAAGDGVCLKAEAAIGTSAANVVSSAGGRRYIIPVSETSRYLWIRPDGLAEQAEENTTVATLRNFSTVNVITIEETSPRVQRKIKSLSVSD